jgi:hypothetical protein
MKLFLGIFAAILFFGSVGSAQDAELMEQKTKIERLITERMKSTIATSLERNVFDVSVTVQLEPMPPKDKDKDKDPTAEPPPPSEEASELKSMDDLQMGLLNAEELIRNYEKEVRSLRLAKEEANRQKVEAEKKMNYEIRQVHVTVGLQEDLGDEYLKEFTGWLEARVKAEFGAIGKSEVSKIKPKPKKVEPVHQKTPMEIAKDFQLALAALLGIFGLLIAIVLFKLLGSRDASETRRLELQMAQASLALSMNQQPKTPLLSGESENVGLLQKKSDVNNLAQMKNLKDQMAKLAMLLVRSDLDASRIVSFWLESGDDGLQKTAVLFDALLSQENQGDNDDRCISILKSIIISDAHKKTVAETLVKMKATPTEQKNIYVESAYWDLLSFQIIGEQFLRRPFSYVNALDPRDVKDVLLKQPSAIRSVALLSLPTSMQTKIVSELGPDLRKDLVEQTMRLPEIPLSEVDAISETLKVVLQGQNKRGEKLSGMVLLPTLLATFAPSEEITCLSELAHSNPEQVENIRAEWPTLAFFTLWSQVAMQKIATRFNNEELLAIITVLPATKDLILSISSARVREIVEDSLRLNSKMDPDQLNAYLASARGKLINAISNKEISLENLYALEEDASATTSVDAETIDTDNLAA